MLSKVDPTTLNPRNPYHIVLLLRLHQRSLEKDAQKRSAVKRQRPTLDRQVSRLTARLGASQKQNLVGKRISGLEKLCTQKCAVVDSSGKRSGDSVRLRKFWTVVGGQNLPRPAPKKRGPVKQQLVKKTTTAAGASGPRPTGSALAGRRRTRPGRSSPVSGRHLRGSRQALAAPARLQATSRCLVPVHPTSINDALKCQIVFHSPTERKTAVKRASAALAILTSGLSFDVKKFNFVLQTKMQKLLFLQLYKKLMRNVRKAGQFSGSGSISEKMFRKNAWLQRVCELGERAAHPGCGVTFKIAQRRRTDSRKGTGEAGRSRRSLSRRRGRTVGAGAKLPPSKRVVGAPSSVRGASPPAKKHRTTSPPAKKPRVVAPTSKNKQPLPQQVQPTNFVKQIRAAFANKKSILPILRVWCQKRSIHWTGAKGKAKVTLLIVHNFV